MKSLKVQLVTLLTVILTFGLTLPSKSFFAGNPVFVEISTEWCGACKMLEPVIEELKKEYAGQITFLKLDATNEESILASQAIAREYGVEEFFNNSRDAFPRVGIFCSNSELPDHNLLGYRPAESYREILSALASDGGICSLSDSATPKQADLGPGRPEDPKYPIVEGGRPEAPVIDGRPVSPNLAGRPKELSFWLAGEPIPFYAYFQFLAFPKCTADSNIVCSNYDDLENSSDSKNDKPKFKPWDPNATRNEKGFDSLKKG